MDEALINENLSFQAFRSARERFLVERATDAALVCTARRAREARPDPSSDSPPVSQQDYAAVRRAPA
jgi:hypothetical protein